MSVNIKSNTDGTSGVIQINGNDIVTVNSSGRVGIGTTSPGSKLDVRGADDVAWITSSTTSSGVLMFDSVAAIRIGSRSGAAIIDTGSAERMRITSAGNVGIGTSSPNGLLSLGISSRSAAAVATYPTPDISGINTYYLSTDGTRFTDIYAGGAPNGAAGGSNLRFLTNDITAGTYPVERMRIDSAGNVGIGDTNPSSTGADKSLVVATSGNVCISKSYTTSTASTASARFDWAIGRANAFAIAALNDNNGSPNWVFSTGSGITQPIYFINGTGGVYLAKNATSWTANSDERVKDIIEPITRAVDKLATLRTVFGKYKDDISDVRRPFLIAQDLQKVYPEVVTEPAPLEGQEFAPLGVSYTDLIPVLVAAINELSERLAKVESK